MNIPRGLASLPPPRPPLYVLSPRPRTPEEGAGEEEKRETEGGGGERERKEEEKGRGKERRGRGKREKERGERKRGGFIEEEEWAAEMWSRWIRHALHFYSSRDDKHRFHSITSEHPRERERLGARTVKRERGEGWGMD